MNYGQKKAIDVLYETGKPEHDTFNELLGEARLTYGPSYVLRECYHPIQTIAGWKLLLRTLTGNLANELNKAFEDGKAFEQGMKRIEGDEYASPPDEAAHKRVPDVPQTVNLICATESFQAQQLRFLAQHDFIVERYKPDRYVDGSTHWRRSTGLESHCTFNNFEEAIEHALGKVREQNPGMEMPDFHAPEEQPVNLTGQDLAVLQDMIGLALAAKVRAPETWRETRDKINKISAMIERSS